MPTALREFRDNFDYADTAALLAAWGVGGVTPLVTLEPTPSRIRVESGGASNAYAFQILPTIPGRRHRLTGNVVDRTNNSGRVFVGTSENNGNLGVKFTIANGFFKLYFVPTSAQTWLTIWVPAIGDFLEIDSLLVVR